MLRPFSALCPPVISFAWPSICPITQTPQGWDDFDRNIKAADQTESTVHVKQTGDPEGRKHVSWLSRPLPQKLHSKAVGLYVEPAMYDPLVNAPTPQTQTQHMKVACAGREASYIYWSAFQEKRCMFVCYLSP